MGELQELRDYIDELHAKIDYDDYVNSMNLVDEIDTQLRWKNESFYNSGHNGQYW